MTTTYYKADARNLDMIDDCSVQLCVTSPAYWGKRAYGSDPREFGRGSLEDYLKETLAWTSEVWRVLKDRGLFFLNIGDTSSGSGGAGGDHNRNGSKEVIPRYRQGDSGLGRMQACLIPQKIAIALQADGWIIRKWIVWSKGQCKPEDVKHTRRPLDAHEVILMLAKSTDYCYYPKAHLKYDIELGDVWSFPPYRGRRVGPAPFPVELPRRCIALGTRRGDTVLDPFIGSGATAKAAEELGRHCIGVDLYLGERVLV